jgi:hypothetical protein
VSSMSRRVVTLGAALSCVLALEAPALGASGWVLWGHTVDPWNALVTLRLGTWASRVRCEYERRKREQGPEELRMADYACLPEGVDPQGARDREGEIPWKSPPPPCHDHVRLP